MKIKSLFLKHKVNNYMMIDGKKTVCEKIFLKSSKILQKNTTKNYRNVVKLAIINTAPTIQLKQIKEKKRKTVKEFPFILNKKNRLTLSIKSILRSLRKNTGTKIENSLPFELLLIANNKSDILKTKKDNHKLALTKKKYIFFRWFC